MTKNKKWYDMPYASTQVSVENTKLKIAELLKKYSIIDIQHTEYNKEYILRFIFNKKAYQIKIKIPELQQQARQKLRALYWYIKARLESLDFGITTFEQEFVGEMLLKLPSGETTTVAELVRDQSDRLEYNQGLWLPFKREE